MIEHLKQFFEQCDEDFFNLLTGLSQGSVVIDQRGTIVWISQGYCRLLGQDYQQLIGREVESVVATTQLLRVVKTGKPTLVDLMQINGHWCVVTRLPLKNEQQQVVGAVGIIYYDNIAQLGPMFERFSQLQKKFQTQVLERQARYSFDDLIGQSPEMLQFKRQALRAAQVDATVLLCGETGTGKELIAQSIHQTSSRSKGPFVGINMGALPEALVESELFGAAPGAFTGVQKGRVGKVLLANGGTLFLDEIAEMPMALQAKLLRVLQEREVEALGSNQLKRVDIRVIAASAVDLEQRVAQGLFRADLFYRLNVVQLTVPPLRARGQDIQLLAEHFLAELLEQSGLADIRLSEQAVAALCHYDWPGNVRELRNRIERGCVMAEGAEISAADLGQWPARPVQSSVDDAQGLRQAKQRLELQTIEQVIAQCGGNKSLAAKRLGISRSSLYSKLR